MTFLIIFGILLSIIAVTTGKPLMRQRRRAYLKSQAFLPAWKFFLERRLPLYARLPSALKEQLHGHIQIFLDEKQFVGCAGLLITDEMKVTIAAQACVLLLNRTTDYYANLKYILVYPSLFIVKREVTDFAGIHTLERQVLAGESWETGKVIISWESVQYDTQHMDDGSNVVFHEFAHQLDHESGSTNGAPVLQNPSSYRAWAQILSQEYYNLHEKISLGEPDVIDSYGAQSPAEFFAVVTETFFERSSLLKAYHPQLYEQLKNYYHVDPCMW